MKTLLISLAFLPVFSFAWSPSPRIPTEDYKYDCQAKVHEQIGGEYVTAFMNFSVEKNDSKSIHGYYREFTSADLTLDDYSKSKGKEVPKETWGSVSLNFGYTTNPDTEDKVVVSGRAGRAAVGYADSTAYASFSRKETVHHSASMYTKANDTIIGLSVTCKRVR